ncbi:MAG: DUF445 domain-containing protein [Burkholderiales bacterium]
MELSLWTPDARDIRLRTMKRRATALLLVVIMVYIASVSFAADVAWLSYVAAAAEAGIVGALADWFAVVALFHHPLHISAIPHTNIIPRNKGRLAQQTGEFIQREFLSPELVTVRIRDFNPARRLAEWLFKADNVDRIAAYIRYVVAYSLNALDDPRVRHFLYEAIGKNLRQVDFARLAAIGLDILTHEKRHHVLLDALLSAADEVLARDSTRRFIADELARQFWLIKISQKMGWNLSETTAAKIVDVCVNLLSEVRNDKEHELRRRFDTSIGGLVLRLQNDEPLRSRLQRLIHEALDSSALHRYAETLWTELHAWVQSDVQKENSLIQSQAAAIVRFFGQKLHDDEAVQDWINEQIIEQAPIFIQRYRRDIGRFIEDQINSWTSEKLVGEFERAIGPDLQYIRINGTVVGAAVGLAIYVLTDVFLK